MKAKKILFALFALVCVLAVSVSFSSCSKDDDNETLLYYRLGFSKVNGNLTESAFIDDTFKAALGVTTDEFTSYPGGDEKIKANCGKAASQLNGMAFTGTYTYVVTKITSKGSSDIYSWTNPSN